MIAGVARPPSPCGACGAVYHPPPDLSLAACAAACCDRPVCPLRLGRPRRLTPAAILSDDGPSLTGPYIPPPRVRRRETPGDGLFDADTPEG